MAREVFWGVVYRMLPSVAIGLGIGIWHGRVHDQPNKTISHTGSAVDFARDLFDLPSVVPTCPLNSLAIGVPSSRQENKQSWFGRSRSANFPMLAAGLFMTSFRMRKLKTTTVLPK